MLPVVVIMLLYFHQSTEKVCKTLEDYSPLKKNPNCWIDLDVYLNTPQTIMYHGYPLEIHKVITEDGYILSVYRIPNKGPPVFFQHGIWVSSDVFVGNKENSAAFIFAKAGYDVWLGNSRGNTYSRKHNTLSTKNPEYWKFNIDDLANKDLPASLEYVSTVTKSRENIIFIGHSMGATLAYMYSLNLENHARNNLKLIISLAPVVFLEHLRTPFKFLLQYSNLIEALSELLPTGEFLPHSGIISLMEPGCTEFSLTFKICKNMIFLIFGIDPYQLLPERIPTIVSHHPAGSSIFTLIQYAQNYGNPGRFRKYDFGFTGNEMKYGTRSAPEYNISAIPVPVHVIYGRNDFLATPEDVGKLYETLPNSKLPIYEVADINFTHVDFVYGKDAKKLVYDEVLKLIEGL